MGPIPSGPVPLPAGIVITSFPICLRKLSVSCLLSAETFRSNAGGRGSSSDIFNTQEPIPRPVMGPCPNGPVPSNPGISVSLFACLARAYRDVGHENAVDGRRSQASRMRYSSIARVRRRPARRPRVRRFERSRERPPRSDPFPAAWRSLRISIRWCQTRPLLWPGREGQHAQRSARSVQAPGYHQHPPVKESWPRRIGEILGLASLESRSSSRQE